MSDATGNRNLFLPLLLPTLAILLFAGTQLRSTLIVGDRMEAQKTAQAKDYQQAQKVRDQLSNLAAELQQLADNGNANAQQIVQKLQQRGVSVNSPGAK